MAMSLDVVCRVREVELLDASFPHVHDRCLFAAHHHIFVVEDLDDVTDADHLLENGTLADDHILDGGIIDRQVVVQDQNEAFCRAVVFEIQIEVAFTPVGVARHVEQAAHGFLVDLAAAVR